MTGPDVPVPLSAGDREGDALAVMAEAFKGRTRALKTSLEHQWRPVIMPALVLWALATVLSCSILHPFDVVEYEFYAHAALHAPLLHRLPVEYPAPALLVFLAPFLLPFSYPWAFAVLAGIVMVVLVASYEGSGVSGMDMAAARRQRAGRVRSLSRPQGADAGAEFPRESTGGDGQRDPERVRRP